MPEQQHIILPEPTLRRLPWYLAYIDILRSQGVKTVSSTKIAKAINVDSSIIAKDLSFLNVRGKTRIGYEVNLLSEVLSNFLGFKQSHKAVVVGVGSLGASLIHDTGLANYGLDIVAGFDTNPALIGTEICGIPIHNINEFAQVREATDATIGILTVPFTQAQDAADTMVAAGIKAIWNFTPCRVRIGEGIVMTSTSIYAHLALIYNRLEANGSL
ncbi:MAG: redox-sensing transcriptional repressor Rex [Bacteroidales bacterium]|nr:redox-sensing transcriptional repressor Rex [Bacteroidales bacterium]MBD5216880.1 redox-sensing transcriptional repressor Rex [Bacteroidales bacterium]MBD5221500.1 redox-sensing transcriptional repressor Rex [Bacteroidales bacterium]